MMVFAVPAFVLWFVWPAVIGYLTYWYLTRNHDYWKIKGIPYVPAIAVAGSLHTSFNKPYHKEEIRRYKKYGRLYGFYEGTRPVLNVSDPELLRNILVKEFTSFPNRRSFPIDDDAIGKILPILEGEDWKRVRSIISPAFSTGKLKRMLNIFKDCARTLSDNFRAATEEGKTINVKKLFGTYTMDVIASSAFSTKISSHNDPNNKFVKSAHGAFDVKYPWRFIFFFLFPGFMKFFKINIFQPKAIDFFKEVTLQIIHERKKTGQTRNDFMQLLIDVAEEVKEEEENEDIKDDTEGMISNYGTEENSDFFKQYMKNKSLSRDEMVAQCVIFFLAGYGPITATLSFATYNLALNEDCQEKLIQEIDIAVKNAGGELNYEAIQNMKYLDNVVSETLRLFPPAIRLERVAGEDFTLGDAGITIPKGLLIGVSVYAMNRDPEFFPNSDKFDPDRFTAEAKASRNPYTYLPFGAGPRNCLGMRFALLEMKMCLAYVFSHFRVRRCPETKVPVEYDNLEFSLLQPKEILLKFEVRKDGVLTC